MPTATLQPRKVKALPIRRSAGLLRIGYVPLIDAAPLLVAQEMGFFEKAGLKVRLDRELGWGSIREKIAYGEIEAAHAPGGLLFSILCGTHSITRAVSTDLVLNLQGNAITLSRRLWEKGVRDTASLKQLIASERPKRLTFACVSHFSSHSYLLRQWLSAGHINPDRDIRIVFLPPALVGEHMNEGHIDGFCVGEPWNSAAVLDGDGWIVATSATLAPGHPEKVLIIGDELRRERHEEYAALRQAILSACRFCDTPQGRSELVELFHARNIFPLSKKVLANSLIGPLQKGAEQPPETASLFYFFKEEANRATHERALWTLETLESSSGISMDGGQRRACLNSFHDILPEPVKSSKPIKQKTKQ